MKTEILLKMNQTDVGNRMKLISKQTALERVEHWFDIPKTHQLVDIAYYRNDKFAAPFYTLDMYFTRGGRAYLTKRGLVSNTAIDVSIDALTGSIVRYMNRSIRPSRKAGGLADVERDTGIQQQTMDDATFKVAHAAVMSWIQILDLHIEDTELMLQRGTVSENGGYKLEYRRCWNGLWLFNFQSFDVTLDHKLRLVSLFRRWDDVDFEMAANCLTESDIRKKMLEGDVYLLPALPWSGPSWLIKPITYDAVTGEVIPEPEGYEAIRTVVCDGSTTTRRPKMTRKPLLTEDAYELLRLPDDVTDVSPMDPTPCAPFLTDDEEHLAIEAACEFVKDYGRRGDVFTLVQSRGEPLAQVIINRVGLRFIRGTEDMISDHQIIEQDSLVVWLDRWTGEVIHFMERSRLREALGRKTVTDENLISRDEAWERLRNKLIVRFGFRLHDYNMHGVNPLRRKATLVYKVTCEVECDAKTGEVVRR